MVVSSDRGIMNPPIDMSHRTYLERTPHSPWKLELQAPAVGIPSGQWIIPCGLGIFDNNNNYLGAVTMGFSIEGLAKKIKQSLGIGDVFFVILTKDFEYVVGTFGGKKSDDRFFFKRHLENINENLGSSGYIKNPPVFDNVIYSYYYKTSKYDYIILTGYSKNIFEQIFQEVLLPRILEFIVIGIIGVLVLLLLQRKLIKPVIVLAECADKMARGNMNIRFPEYESKEIGVLTKQMISVKSYIEEIQAIRKELTISKKKAEEASQAKSAFLANMSHELRTPLVTINGYAELISAEIYGPIDEKYKDSAKFINNAGQHLLVLINDVLDISKIEAGKMDIKDEKCNVVELINGCLDYISPLASKNGITINTKFTKKLPTLIADHLRIRQVILNILANSVKFTPTGGLIKISANMRNGLLLIIIEDTGIGIAKKNIEKVMLNFGQVDDISMEQQGTGLGLPISKRLIELHKGTFILESKLNKGTKVKIIFPSERLC